MPWDPNHAAYPPHRVQIASSVGKTANVINKGQNTMSIKAPRNWLTLWCFYISVVKYSYWSHVSPVLPTRCDWCEPLPRDSRCIACWTQQNFTSYYYYYYYYYHHHYYYYYYYYCLLKNLCSWSSCYFTYSLSMLVGHAVWIFENWIPKQICR